MTPKPSSTDVSGIDLDEVDTDSFHIVSLETANWVVRRIVEARAYRQNVESWAASEIQRAEREEAFFHSRWGSELEAFTRGRISQQHKRKSICLPAGTIGFRTSSKRLEIRDERRLLAWCRLALPTAIRTSERLLTSVILDHVDQTGELPDGSELAGGDQRFFIR